MALIKKYCLLGVFIVFFFSSLLAQDNYMIKDLKISGIKSVSEDDLKEKLIIKDRTIWNKIMFWKEAERFYETDLNSDLELIKNFYYKEGFLDVQVDSEVIENTEKESVEIKFIIQENEPVLIEDVTYNLEIATSADTVMTQPMFDKFVKGLSFEKESRFRDEDLLLTQNDLENWLVKYGYAYNEINYNLQVKKEENLVNVDFNLDTGPLCYFGETTFKGVEKVPYSILEKQLDPPGEIYSEKYLNSLQRNLQRIGMFQYVTVNSVLDEEETNPVPIVVDLKESPRLSLQYAVGYGEEDKIRTSLTVTKLGFLGGIRRAVFYAKYSSLEPYNLSLKVIQPALFHPAGALTLNPFARKEAEDSYTLTRKGSTISYQLGLGSFVNSYLNFGLEWNQLEAASPSLEDDLIANGKGNYRQSTSTIGLIYDDSQPMFSPNQGIYFASSFTWSGIGFANDYHYTMTSSEVRNYLTVYKEIVLASRVKGGFMKSLRADEVTPIADRFNSGGSNSIRGWARYDLGPKSDDNLSLGGNSLLETSLEIRYPIWSRLSGVVFCDAGNVWEGSYDHNLTDLEYAAGGGLRVRTPLGPVRFDIAFPLSEPDKKFQFYLNIGEAF